MRLGGYSTYSRIVPLVAVATLLLPLVPVIPVTAAGDELACALAPNDAGTGQDAAATELLGTPLALSVGVLETTGCFHRGDADDWFRVTSTPGAGHNLLVEVTGPTHNATPQILISDCMGKTLVAGHYWDERTVRAGMSFTPEYPALCVDVAPWVDVAYSAPFVVTAFGTQVPYELRFTLTKAACVDDDGGSGRDSDWVRPVDLAIDVYGAGATFTGCFPGEDWSNDFQAYDRWDDHYRFHAEAGRPFHVEVRSLSCQTSHSITLYAPETTTQGWPNSNYGSLYSGGCTAQGGAFTPTRTGLQRLRVSPSQGSYQITLSPVKGPCGVQSDGGSGADAPATESNAVLVQPGAPLQGCLDDVDKKDVYRIPVSASERVTVSIARDPVSGTFPRHLSAELVDDRGVVLRHWWGGYSAYDPSDQGLLSGVASRNGTWTLRFTGSGNHVAYGFTPTAEALPSPVQGASGGYVLNHAGAVQACGGTAYMVSRSGDVLRLGPTAATRLWSDPEDYPFTSHPACGADGSLLYSLPRYVNGRATGLLHEFAAPLGSTPPRAILPVDRLIAGPGGALYDATAKGLNRVDCSARTTTPVQPLPSGSFSYAFAPDGDLYAANATGLHRVGPTGALAPVFLPGTVGHPGRIAFDLLGNAYLGDGRENVIWRINLATGEGALLLGDAGGGPNLAFHGSRLWAAMYTGGNYRVAYWDLGVPGFEGWPAECEPAFADLTPTITGTSRGNGRYLNVDNFPGSRVVVHVDVTNVGPIALTGGYEVTLLVARECDPETVCPFPTPSEQETVVVKDPLEPGETRKLSLRFLPNFYLEGPTRVVVRVAPLVMGDGDRTNDEDERQLPLTSGIV